MAVQPGDRLARTHDPRPGAVAPAEWGAAVEELFDTWTSTHSVAVRITANQSKATGDQSLNFDEAVWDTDGYWSAGNPERITCPVGLDGFYLFCSVVGWAGSATGARRETYLRVNSDNALIFARDVQEPPTGNCDVTCTGIWYLTAGDYVQQRLHQNSGGNLNVRATSDIRSSLRAVWLGR